MDRVVAITVTYNDAEYLKKCITALKQQTYAVARIIVVDNNSNMENRAIIETLNEDDIEILHLAENLGGAGGFEKGMAYAHNNHDPDWYWLMDADAAPRKDCLEKLMVHKSDKAYIGYLAPLIYGADLQQYQLYHHKRLSKYLERDIPLYSTYNEIPETSSIEADAFVGPLFSREAVKKVGNVDGSLFIYGDDLEYTYRVTRKFSALLIREAVIDHRDQPAANGVQKPINWWKDYYMFRNRFLFISKYQQNTMLRNIGYFLVGLRCFKQYIICLTYRMTPELKKVRKQILWNAYKDGKERKSGKIIDPAVFIGKIRGMK